MRNGKIKVLSALAAAAALLAATPAGATVVIWTFSNAELGGNSADTVTGSFDYDTSLNTYTNIDITTTISGVYTAYNDPGSVVRNFGFGALTSAGNAVGDPILDVNAITGETFASPGVDTIGENDSTAIDFVSYNGTCATDGARPCDEFNTDLALTGTLTGVAAAPEPATWALMMFGVFGVGAALRRRSLRPLTA